MEILGGRQAKTASKPMELEWAYQDVGHKSVIWSCPWLEK